MNKSISKEKEYNEKNYYLKYLAIQLKMSDETDD